MRRLLTWGNRPRLRSSESSLRICQRLGATNPHDRHNPLIAQRQRVSPLNGRRVSLARPNRYAVDAAVAMSWVINPLRSDRPTRWKKWRLLNANRRCLDLTFQRADHPSAPKRRPNVRLGTH